MHKISVEAGEITVSTLILYAADRNVEVYYLYFFVAAKV